LFVLVLIAYLINDFFFLAQNKNLIKKRKSFLKVQKFNSWALLEFFWTVFPVFVLLFIAYPSYTLLFIIDESIEPLATLKVVGHQWYWSYDWTWKNTTYLNFDSNLNSETTKKISFGNKNKPTLFATDSSLFFPIKQKVRVLVTAEDVLHSWAIPKLGIKLDCVPGRLNQVFVKINRLGRFFGQCSELCGVGHAQMPIEIYSIN